MLREVAEELHLESAYQEQCIGLINDDSTPVGQVHLGIVHIFDLERPTVRRREQALTQAGFAPLEQLERESNQFESWSQILLAAAQSEENRHFFQPSPPKSIQSISHSPAASSEQSSGNV
jgi:predicted NUDIX family phosphoesterase